MEYVGARPLDAVDSLGLQDPLALRESLMDHFPGLSLPQQQQYIGYDVVVSATDSHAWIEYGYDLGQNDTSLRDPIVVSAEMTGPGYDAALSGIGGVPGQIDIKVYPGQGPNARRLPRSSSDTTRSRRFRGSREDVQRLTDWIERNAYNPEAPSERLVDTMRRCLYEDPNHTAHLAGRRDFQAYGVPAFAGRQNCATFAGTAAEIYSGKHWAEIFNGSAHLMTPGNLMYGHAYPVISVWAPPDMSLPHQR